MTVSSWIKSDLLSQILTFLTSGRIIHHNVIATLDGPTFIVILVISVIMCIPGRDTWLHVTVTLLKLDTF